MPSTVRFAAQSPTPLLVRKSPKTTTSPGLSGVTPSGDLIVYCFSSATLAVAGALSVLPPTAGTPCLSASSPQGSSPHTRAFRSRLELDDVDLPLEVTGIVHA